MLHSTTELIGYNVVADGGKVGKVYDFLFDDAEWTIRCFVLRTGAWLMKRLVVVARSFIRQPDAANHFIPVSLRKDQIKNSPRLEAYRSVYRYRQVDPYVSPVGLATGTGGVLLVHRRGAAPSDEGDPHQKSIKEVIAYHVIATDGEVGYVDDFIVDDQGWIIRHLVVMHMQDSLSARKVLISPASVKEIRWKEEKVYIDLSQEKIQDSPDYNPSIPLTREYEELLYDYYGLPGYWS